MDTSFKFLVLTSIALPSGSNRVLYKIQRTFVRNLFVVFFMLVQVIETKPAHADELMLTQPNDTFEETLSNLPSCKEYFPNLDYIEALKSKLEKDLGTETGYPTSEPVYEIIWYGPGEIKAIIELDNQKEWNGSIHSWYENGAYLGCAGLENGQHQGISIAYHSNGNIRAIANFLDGIPIDVEYQFDKLGKLFSTKNHDTNSVDETSPKNFKH